MLDRGRFSSVGVEKFNNNKHDFGIFTGNSRIEFEKLYFFKPLEFVFFNLIDP